MPTTGVGPTGGPGRRVSGPAPRITFFAWREITLEAQRAVTPAEGETEGPLAPEAHVRRALGIDAARESGDARPTLVYFHWPHDDSATGKLSDKICDRVLDDEEAARWGLLFRCVQIDMAASDERLTGLLEAGSRPSFLVLDADGTVADRLGTPTSSPRLAKALEKALKRCEPAWQALEETLERQERWLDEAEGFLAKDEATRALERLDRIRFSDVRVGKCFEKAMALGMQVAQRVEREAK